jgi:sulfotransferase family protein
MIREGLHRGCGSGILTAARDAPAVAATDAKPADFGDQDAPNLIVTGVSRSGTSYLCNLLHRFDNCVAINEPREVISVLRDEVVPWGVPAFYGKLRIDIQARRPIANKVRRGQVVEDTARSARRRFYRPRVSGDDFVLAVKNTREFLLRLDAVRSVMPAARIVACVRNPLDTIASWKRSFPHLHDADVGPFVRHPHCMWLPQEQREALRSIEATPHLAERRALWWRFLAERALEHRGELVLVRYEELVSEPMLALHRILAGFRPGSLRSPVVPSAARSCRALLDDDDLIAISEICASTAADLGLPVPQG